MSGIYHVSFPDGVEPDEYVKNLRQSFNNARGRNEEVQVDLTEEFKGERRPARLIMASVKETGETTTYDGFTARGFGIIGSDYEDIDPRRDARPIECCFNLKTNNVIVETLKKFGA